MVHFHTQQCVSKAKTLLLSADSDSLRYASIQLRMGIEYLFYELLPLYREELPIDILGKWQPQQILDALLECDPSVDHDGQLFLGPDQTAGIDSHPGIVRDIKAPNKKLLRNHYHRLGAYLHAPVDLQLPDISKWRDDLNKVVETLSQYNDSQILCNIRPLVKFPCENCGRTIARNRHGVEKSGEMKCLDPKCNAIYDVTFDGDLMKFQLRSGQYDCPYCKTQNSFSEGLVKDGFVIRCVQCNKRVVTRSSFALELLDDLPYANDGIT